MVGSDSLSDMRKSSNSSFSPSTIGRNVGLFCHFVGVKVERGGNCLDHSLSLICTTSDISVSVMNEAIVKYGTKRALGDGAPGCPRPRAYYPKTVSTLRVDMAWGKISTS